MRRPALARDPVVLALLVGSIADRALGDPARRHPVAGFGKAVLWAERRWYRPTRPRGLVFTSSAVLATTAAVAALDQLLRPRPAVRAAAGGAVIWATLGGRSLWRVGDELAALLEANEIAAARALLPSLAGRDPSGLDASQLARAGTESVAENTGDAVVGALLWGALFGPAGAAGFRAANTLDAMLGHRSERYLRFGWSAARLDDGLGYLPARAGAWLAVAAAPLVAGSSWTTARVLLRDGAAHPSPNAGRLEAAFAGALGLQLGGPLHYGSRREERPTLGDGRAPDATGLRGAVRLSQAVTVGTVACSIVVRAGLSRLRRHAGTLTP